MNILRAPFVPSSQSSGIIRKCAANLAPSDQELTAWHTNYVQNHSDRLALDLDLIGDRVSKGASVLEFGSIPLLLTAALLQSGYRVTGIDLAPERYSSTIEKLKLDILKCNVEQSRLPFPDESFDAIVFNELFEHLRINPILTLSEALRVLRVGGVFMMSTPNLRSLHGIRNFVFKNRAYSCAGDIYDEYAKVEKLGHMGHVREYTTSEVRDFLRKVGFRVTHAVFRGGYDRWMENKALQLWPTFSPFVSIIAAKS